MVTIDQGGKVIFRVFFPHAASVELIGSFTDWTRAPLAMTRQFPGWWIVKVAVPVGSHTFAYRVDLGTQVADYAAHGVEQTSGGGWISRLNVTGDVPVDVDSIESLRVQTAPSRQATPAPASR